MRKIEGAQQPGAKLSPCHLGCIYCALCMIYAICLWNVCYQSSSLIYMFPKCAVELCAEHITSVREVWGGGSCHVYLQLVAPCTWLPTMYNLCTGLLYSMAPSRLIHLLYCVMNCHRQNSPENVCRFLTMKVHDTIHLSFVKVVCYFTFYNLRCHC